MIKEYIAYLKDNLRGLPKDAGSGIYQCPECGLKYKEKEWAEKCEAWCRSNHSCNLEITAHAEK